MIGIEWLPGGHHPEQERVREILAVLSPSGARAVRSALAGGGDR
jgi:hypothetical protein